MTGECAVSSSPVRISGPEGYVRGSCVCGWTTPQAWSTLAGAEAAVRSEHIDREKLLAVLAIKPDVA